jgi:hypothetical protein
LEEDLTNKNIIRFDDFRLLLLHKNSSPIDWALNCKTNPSIKIENTEYHLIRQIIMLHHRKITDIASAIQSLKPYSTFEIFNHLSLFQNPNPNLNSLVFDDGMKRYSASKSMMQKSLQLSTSPNLKSNKSFILNSQGKIIENDSQSNYFKKINVFDKFNSVIENKSMHRRSHTLGNFTKKNSLDKSLNNNTVDLGSYIDLETIVNFLEFNNVPFLPNDISLIFEEMGSMNGTLKFDQIDKYFGLQVWF